MVKLRSRKENENACAVLTDKTNVTNNRVTKKTVKALKPAIKVVSKPLTAKNDNNEQPVSRSKPVLGSSADDQNDENTCSNVPLKKNLPIFKKHVPSNGVEAKPNSDEETTRPKRKHIKEEKFKGQVGTKTALVSLDKNKVSETTNSNVPLGNANSSKNPVFSNSATTSPFSIKDVSLFTKPKQKSTKDGKSANIKLMPLASPISLDQDRIDENMCSSTPLCKNDNSFKKPVSRNLVSTKPIMSSAKPRRKQTKDNKIVPISKSTKNKLVRQPMTSSVKNLLPNYFGFDDSDLENDQSPCKTELSKFDPSKPYRLALYVKPSRTIRINPALAKRIQSFHQSLNLTNISMMDNSVAVKPNVCSESMMSPNRTQFKVPFSSTPLPVKKTAAKLVQKKITDVLQVSPKRTRAGNADRQFKSYFEKSLTSEEEVSPPPKPVAKKRTSYESICSDSNEEIEETIIPVATFKKSRRSYIKKSKPLPEPVDEPPSDEVIKSIEKVKKKGKSKKAEREDQEFEKWSQSMNSMFSEVDQFEMSFG